MKMIMQCVSLLVFNIKSFYRMSLYSPTEITSTRVSQK